MTDAVVETITSCGQSKNRLSRKCQGGREKGRLRVANEQGEDWVGARPGTQVSQTGRQRARSPRRKKTEVRVGTEYRDELGVSAETDAETDVDTHAVHYGAKRGEKRREKKRGRVGRERIKRRDNRQGGSEAERGVTDALGNAVIGTCLK